MKKYIRSEHETERHPSRTGYYRQPIGLAVSPPSKNKQRKEQKETLYDVHDFRKQHMGTFTREEILDKFYISSTTFSTCVDKNIRASTLYYITTQKQTTP